MAFTKVTWPARLQNLGQGHLRQFVAEQNELWLDGGHNGPAGVVLAQALRAMPKRPMVMIWGMLNTKHPGAFIANFKGLADFIFTLAIPDEANAISAEDLSRIALENGLKAAPAESLERALDKAAQFNPHARILICGSLYLAGHVLALHNGETPSAVSGAAKR